MSIPCTTIPIPPMRPNIRPTSRSFMAQRCSATRGKVNSIIAKARVAAKVSRMARPTTGWESPLQRAKRPNRRGWTARPRSGRLSGRPNHAHTKFTVDSAAASQIGAVIPNTESSPPTQGPMVNPIPNAAPMRPIPRARFSGVVTSATYAWAVEMFAAKAPCNSRNRNSSQSVCERAKAANDAAVAPMDRSMIDRRPKRSESAPHIGANTNCARE